MKLTEFQRHVNKAVENCERNRLDPSKVDVCIRTHMLGTAGPAPRTDIDGAMMGGDFDRGVFLIEAGVKLREVGLDEIAVLREKYEEFCCSVDEVRALKRKLKKYEEAEKNK